MKPDIAPTTTELNRQALKRLASLYLLELHEAHPAWTLEDVFGKAGIPHTALFLELGKQAGFRKRADPSSEEMGRRG